jgi:Chaperone of endosialidase
MKPLIQFQAKVLSLFGAPILACLLLAPTARAVNPPPDGGYPGANTAEGTEALNSIILPSPARGGELGGLRNTAIGYQTLFSLTVGRDNTATGYQALKNNTASFNSAFGGLALFGNITGTQNTAVGWGASRESLGGNDNTAVGYNALTDSVTSQNNTAIGSQALAHTSINASDNTAIGYQALFNTEGDFNGLTGLRNTGIGSQALYNNTTGNGNTAIGYQALYGASGQNSNGNIAIGRGAGYNVTTGSSNIHIGNPGIAADSQVIRIGDTQTKTYIAGIFGTSVPGLPVNVNSSGQLGVVPSSNRFKTEIRPMDKASEAIHALNPITFRYKKEFDAEATPQFGLVAEEVEKVNPSLVVRDSDGKPYTVRYEAVNAMLLNEFLKEHQTVQKQQREIDALKAELKEQRALIQAVNDKVELSKSAPQTVLNNQ